MSNLFLDEHVASFINWLVASLAIKFQIWLITSSKKYIFTYFLKPILFIYFI